MIKNSSVCGWFLLLLGLGIIFWTFYSSYNIFTAKTPMPEVFKTEEETEAPSADQKPLTPQAQLEKTLQEQIKEMLPADILPQLLNLVSWSIFAGILTFGGAQVASLGIKLIK